METNKRHVLGRTSEELKAEFAELGLEPYRAGQVMEWVYEKRRADFAEMTNLGKSLRERLAAAYEVLSGQELAVRESADGTVKLLLGFGGGRQVETVLIPGPTWRTACLSTQFGCPIGCAFCATGQGHFGGNLTAGQIVEQLLRLQIIADASGERIGHVVFMGMGEPLLNYENTLKAIRIINAPWGPHIGARHITLSTAGVVEGIRRLASEELQITLAISLHSADQSVRERLIPLARKATIDQIVEAARFYFEKTGREITIEYLMLEGVNVSADDARKLAGVAKTMRANVNLIVFNPIEGSEFRPPTRQAIDIFVAHLRRLKVNAHLRASKGRDIEAACGQLRQRHEIRGQSQTP